MDLSTSYTIKAQVTGQNQIAGLKSGLDKLKTSSNNAAGAMAKLKGAASQAFGALKALAPAIGIAGVGKLVNDTLTLGDELGKLNEQTGITVPTLDRLRQAADLAGVDFKKVSKSFGIFSENIMDFTRGKGMALDALEQLNIDPTFINTRGVEQLKEIDQLLFEVAEALRNLPSGSSLEAVDLAKTIFGGQGMKMIPLLNQGKEAIMGLDTAFTGDFADRIEDFNDSMAQLGEKFNFLKFSLTESLLPALEIAVDMFTKVAEFLKGLPKPIQSAIIGFSLLAPAIIALAPVIAALIFSFKTIAALKMGLVIAKITTAFGGVIAAVKGAILAFAPLLPAGLIGAAIIGLGALIFKFREEIAFGFKVVSQKIQEFFSHVADFVGGIFNRISQFISPFVNFFQNAFKSAINNAENTFNRLPKFVQNAIKIATAPITSFIKNVQKALDFLGRLMGARKKAAKMPSMPSSGGSNSSLPEYSPVAKNLPSSLPRTYGYEETDFSSGNIGSNYKGATSTSGISEFPSGLGSNISRRSSRSKDPNINIKTGDVTQIDGTNYVTTRDLTNAVQSSVKQTMNYLEADGVRYDLGM